MPVRWVVMALVATTLAGCASRPPVSPPADRSDPLVRSCEDTAGAASWQGSTRADRGTAALDAHDDYFAATCILVPWNRQVRLTVTNRGHVPHDLNVGGGLLADVDAGQTVFVTLPATTVALRFVCSYHTRERMYGAIVPVPPSADRAAPR